VSRGVISQSGQKVLGPGGSISVEHSIGGKKVLHGTENLLLGVLSNEGTGIFVELMRDRKPLQKVAGSQAAREREILALLRGGEVGARWGETESIRL